MDKIFRNKMKEIFDKYDNGADVYSDELKEFSELLLKFKRKKQPLYLYRFSKADLYALMSLDTDKIYLSAAGDMNDVFEGIQIADDDVPEHSKLKLISDVVCIKSFCEENNSLYMWGNYADSFKGICVKYDLSLLDDESEIFNCLFPVLYSDTRFVGGYKFSEIIECLDDYICGGTKHGLEEISEINSLYLVKSTEWQSEKEWRILKNKYEIEESGSQYISMPCISDIYLGAKIDPVVKDYIINIVRRKNDTINHTINVYRSNLHKTEYRLEYERLLL